MVLTKIIKFYTGKLKYRLIDVFLPERSALLVFKLIIALSISQSSNLRGSTALTSTVVNSAKSVETFGLTPFFRWPTKILPFLSQSPNEVRKGDWISFRKYFRNLILQMGRSAWYHSLWITLFSIKCSSLFSQVYLSFTQIQTDTVLLRHLVFLAVHYPYKEY